MLSEFTWPEASDDSDRKLLSDIKQYGWNVVQIEEDNDGPAFSFSVGLFHSFGSSEILVMGLKRDVAHRIINNAALHISRGKNFKEFERTGELAEGYDCTFVPIAIENYEEYLGYAIWFYRSLKQPFPALQLIWPDKQGRFPWDSGYDKRFLSLQHVLSDEVPPSS